MGTLFSLLSIVSWTEVGKTVVLGSIGVIVSFLVSWALKKIISCVEKLTVPRTKKNED